MGNINELKWLIENTNLYFYVHGTNPRIVSDFGRAKSIDLENKTVKFSRREEVNRRFDGCTEMGWGADIFFRTEIKFVESNFILYRSTSKENGSWQENELDHFKGQYWDEMYVYIIEVRKRKRIEEMRTLRGKIKWVLSFFRSKKQKESCKK